MTQSLTPLRKQAIAAARQICAAKPIYMDTETTGLNKTDEIVEISVVDHDGSVLFNSLVRPSKPIPEDAIRIHGISNEEVQRARPWPLIWNQLRSVMFGRLIVFYNQDFDLRMMQQSHARYNLPWKDKFNTYDLLKLYAEFRGEWDGVRRSYRYHSLEDAGKQCNISLPNAHRATADTLLTRALLLYIAESE